MANEKKSSIKTKVTNEQPEANWLQRHLNRREIEPPQLFVSLHEVIRKIAECNSPWTYQSAAKTLKRHLMNDNEAPAWRRFTDRGERGELEPNYGNEYGRLLLENAAQFGEPVRWDANFDYGHDHFETLTLPLYQFMKYGPTLGFQMIDVGPFLQRNGVHGFDVHTGDITNVLEPHESENDRQRRRVDRLQALGGGRLFKDGRWKASGKRGALAELAREEKAAGRQYCDERDVARDLDAEAERRRAGRTMLSG